MLNNMKIYMTGITAKADKEVNTAIVTVTIEVDNLETLDYVINKLRSIKGVYNVYRKSKQ